MKKILLYGYGNPGRQDDGLGVLLVEELEKWSRINQIDSIDFDSNYQLNIEDALLISDYEMVIFADASIEEIDDVELTRVVATQKTEFTMHAMTPGFVLHLCESLYGKSPPTFLMHLKGYHFEFQAELSDKAQENLHKGLELLKNILQSSPDDPLHVIEKKHIATA